MCKRAFADFQPLKLLILKALFQQRNLHWSLQPLQRIATPNTLQFEADSQSTVSTSYIISHQSNRTATVNLLFFNTILYTQPTF